MKSDGSTASYYELPENCKELQDLISYRDMNAQIGEIFRACYRYGIASHSDKMRDAKKIMFYAKAEIARLEKLEKVEESKPDSKDFTEKDIRLRLYKEDIPAPEGFYYPFTNENSLMAKLKKKSRGKKNPPIKGDSPISGDKGGDS